MGFEKDRIGHDARKRLADVLPSKLARKWEDRIRNNTLKKGEFTEVNELISYGLDPENEEMHLHVHENLTKGAIDANLSMLNGLRKLANQLKEDPGFANIQLITAYSWIVFDHPDILRRFGFEISEADERERQALATISKVDFIKQFGR